MKYAVGVIQRVYEETTIVVHADSEEQAAEKPKPKPSTGPQGCSCPCGFHGDDFCKLIGCPRKEPAGFKTAHQTVDSMHGVVDEITKPLDPQIGETSAVG